MSDRKFTDDNEMLAHDALALINRQRADIDRMAKLVVGFEEDCTTAITIINRWEKAYASAKAEAIKEFAERLHERLYSIPTVYNSHFGRMIDAVVKEMTEGGEPRKEEGKNG